MSMRYAKSKRLSPKVPALMDEAFVSLQELVRESPERFNMSAFGYAEHDDVTYRYNLSISIHPGEDFSEDGHSFHVAKVGYLRKKLTTQFAELFGLLQEIRPGDIEDMDTLRMLNNSPGEFGASMGREETIEIEEKEHDLSVWWDYEEATKTDEAA